jgi:anaerobic glycerol-3-phosphate dehydrogenase
VRAFQDEEPFESEVANIVFFASASKVEFSHGLVDRWEVLEHVPSGQVISDGLNPLGRLQLRSAADHFAAMSTLLAPAVWAR